MIRIMVIDKAKILCIETIQRKFASQGSATTDQQKHVGEVQVENIFFQISNSNNERGNFEKNFDYS